MQIDPCKQCGSPRLLAKNSRGGFFAKCTSPEKHLKVAADAPTAKTPDEKPEPKPEQPAPEAKKKGFLDSFFS